jgi:hypothetical protein
MKFGRLSLLPGGRALGAGGGKRSAMARLEPRNVAIPPRCAIDQGLKHRRDFRPFASDETA